MPYFDETTDTRLSGWIAEVMSIIYYKQVNITNMEVSPYMAYNLKAEKVNAAMCKPGAIEDQSVKQMTSYKNLVIAGAGYIEGDSVEIIQRLYPDPDIIDKVLRLFLFLDLGDSTNAYDLIANISLETKNVINENLLQVRRQPVPESELTPWQL
jgi:hypothetical protein